MANFKKNQSIADFQLFNHTVYGRVDDRLYSTWDLLTQGHRFATRALKGIRKNDRKKIRENLTISFSWLMAIANRFHVDVEEAVWRRFPMLCSYCGKRPCSCKKEKSLKRKKILINHALRPKTLNEFQKMFEMIYPTRSRTLEHAGVHLAEEMGEMTEAVHNFLGQHKQIQLDAIKNEIADYVSCVFGVANSANIDFAKELAKTFNNNCHVCHKIPCACTFAFVAQFKS